MKRSVFLTTASLCMFACSGDVDEHELNPGKWLMTVEMINIEVPGATPEQSTALKMAIGGKNSQEQCMSPEEAVFGPSSLRDAFPHGDKCRADDFRIASGILSGSMICELPDGTESSTPLKGTVSSDQFSLTVPAELTGDEYPGGSATVTVRVSGAHQGDC